MSSQKLSMSLDDILRRKGKGTTANQQQKSSSSSSSSSGAAAAVSTSSFQGRQGKQAPQQRRPPHKTKPSVEGPLDGLGTHTRKRPSSMVVAAGVKEEEGPSLKVPKKEVLNPLQASLDDLLAAKSKAAKSPFERVKEGERGSKGGKSGAARARMKVEGKYGKQGKHGKQGGRGNGGVHKGGETWGQQQSRPSRQQNRDQSSRSFQRGDQGSKGSRGPNADGSHSHKPRKDFQNSTSGTHMDRPSRRGGKADQITPTRAADGGRGGRHQPVPASGAPFSHLPPPPPPPPSPPPVPSTVPSVGTSSTFSHPSSSYQGWVPSASASASAPQQSPAVPVATGSSSTGGHRLTLHERFAQLEATSTQIVITAFRNRHAV